SSLSSGCHLDFWAHWGPPDCEYTLNPFTLPYRTNWAYLLESSSWETSRNGGPRTGHSCCTTSPRLKIIGLSASTLTTPMMLRSGAVIGNVAKLRDRTP